MAILWTEELATGVREIDEQHKEMFRQINRLLDACHQGRGHEAVGTVLNFLDSYSRKHFQLEEQYMLDYHYPDYKQHKAQHQEFIGNVAEVKRRFLAEGPGVHIVVITNRVLAGWLNSHIRKVDKVLGKYLRPKLEKSG